MRTSADRLSRISMPSSARSGPRRANKGGAITGHCITSISRWLAPSLKPSITRLPCLTAFKATRRRVPGGERCGARNCGVAMPCEAKMDAIRSVTNPA